MLDGDEEDLLAFASGLDIEKYLGDMEIKAMMERVKRRILELEREVVQEGRREAEAEQRAARRAQSDTQVRTVVSLSIPTFSDVYSVVNDIVIIDIAHHTTLLPIIFRNLSPTDYYVLMMVGFCSSVIVVIDIVCE